MLIMAILKNLNKAIFGPHWTQVTVGNNRTIEHVGDGLHLCRLHGHILARVHCTNSGYAKVLLDTCGYKTVTTRSSMNDFMGAFGVRGGVSFAKGSFNVAYYMDDERLTKLSHNPNELSFMAKRYPLIEGIKQC
jgi:hypothetical protein